MFMSLVRIHLHRSLFAFLLCLLVLVPFLLLLRPRPSSRLVAPSDENINLLDLFDKSFQLIHRAGQAIRRLKTSKENWNKVQQKKKAFQHLPSEPVTLADLLSHTILSQGLKKNFPNLQVHFNRRETKTRRTFLDRLRREKPAGWWTNASLKPTIRPEELTSESASDLHRTRSAQCSLVFRGRVDRPVGCHQRIHRFLFASSLFALGNSFC